MARAAWTFEFDDGRQVLVYEQLFATARAGLVSPETPSSLDDAW